MVKIYSFSVDLVDTEKSFSLCFEVAASSLSLAYSRLCKQVVENFSTRVISASIRPVYKVEVNGMCSFRSLPLKYSSVIFDHEDSNGLS